jgi:hypothetical protein
MKLYERLVTRHLYGANLHTADLGGVDLYHANLRSCLKSRGVGFSPEGTYGLARLGSLERPPHTTFQTISQRCRPERSVLQRLHQVVH